MLVPIPTGLEDAAVQRLPWVSIAVALACLLALLYTNTHLEEEAVAQDTLQEAIQYWSERPYLVLPPLLLKKIPPDNIEAIYAAADSFELPPPHQFEEEQAVADELFAKFAAQYDESVRSRYGLKPSRGFEQIGWLTHMFLHSGWMHLLFNMLFSYLSAPFVEDRWGHLFFAGFFVATGLVAGFAYALLDLSSSTVMIGASGAVAGCLGALAYLFPFRRVRMILLLIVIPIFRFRVPVWLWSVGWFAFEVADLLQFGQGGNVAFMAHVGGWLFGFGTAAVLCFTGLDDRLAPDEFDLARTERSFVPGLITTMLVVLLTIIIAASVPDGTSVAEGQIEVRSSQVGARVYINGEPTEHVTPAVVTGLHPRRPYRVQVVKAGFRPDPAIEVVVIPRSLRTPRLSFEMRRVGRLHVTSTPQGARVFVEKREEGLTPFTLPARMTGDRLLLRVVAKGHAPLEQPVVIVAGTSTVNVTLEPAVEFAVSSVPPGAAVSLDGLDLGTTPLSALVPKRKTSSLEIKLAGHFAYKKKIRKPRRPGRIKARLKQVPFSRLKLTPVEKQEATRIRSEIKQQSALLARAKAAVRRSKANVARRRNGKGIYAQAELTRAEEALAAAEYSVEDATIALEDAQARLSTLRETVMQRLAAQ